MINRYKVSSYLSDLNIAIHQDLDDQDYYNLRSHLFASFTDTVLMESHKKDFGKVIRKFVLEVPPYRVYKNYVFKRSAYDASRFFKLFGNDAHELYERIFQYDSSSYTLQQWALYKAYCKDFIGAFDDIDKAISMNHNNFSIKNSRAIILFEANKGKSSPSALNGMKEAMCTLHDCFNSDKRKIYHAQKYAEFALYLACEQSDSQYLEQAKDWLETIISTGESTARKTKVLLRDIKNKLSNI